MRAFLSHSSKDKPVVEQVAAVLGGANIEFDSLTFEYGLPNTKAIQEALKRSTLFVLFLSKDSQESPFVGYEKFVATELVAKGIIDRVLVVCLDGETFAALDQSLKNYNVVRKVTSVQAIARLIQHHLIVASRRNEVRNRPFVGRQRELNEAKNQLVDPLREPTKSIFISGNAGIGRRTFARKLFADVFPYVGAIFPEVFIDSIDGLDEIFRKLLEVHTPITTRSALRATILDFSLKDADGKAAAIATLMTRVVEGREAIFIIDRGGLLDDRGALSEPLTHVHGRLTTYPHPSVLFVAERMSPRSVRDTMRSTVFCAIPALSREESRQLIALTLRRDAIPYTNEDLDQLVDLSDSHPFNIEFITASAKQYSLPVVLGDSSELMQWKRRRGAEFLQRVQFTDGEMILLSALRDFRTLDYATASLLLDDDATALSAALIRLMDFHIIEASGDSYSISPPLRSAIERDSRFDLSTTNRKKILRTVSDTLRTGTDSDEISVSMIDAGILATLQEGDELPPFFASLLLPSHQIWLARHFYDQERFQEAETLAYKSLEARGRLSRAGAVEACRILCLSAARLRHDDEFTFGISVLERFAGDSRATSSAHFLRGFRARLQGHLPEAEKEYRASIEHSPGNFSAVRELAYVCRVRGDFDSAEAFARKAYEIAPDNPYIIDILLTILLNQNSTRHNRDQVEIEFLFEKLRQFGEGADHSFFTARRAEFELKRGNLAEACNLIDLAAKRTPNIFSVHALRARIYLERGNRAVASEEIQRMQKIVDDPNTGSGRSGIRELLELKAEYLVASADYEGAKKVYETANVFTEDEKRKAVKDIDFYNMASHRRQ